jgi:hypothetical protein
MSKGSTLKTLKSYYSLIQYCPDPARLECVNVGVLLLCPETGFLDAKLSQNDDRVQLLFGPNLDLVRFNAAKQAIKNRLKTENIRELKDLSEFIATRANELRITQPRPVKVIRPDQALQDLFDGLVETKVF